VKKLASNKTRALLAKLQALAAKPGTPDEGKAAEKKIAMLQKRYDFSQADISKDDIFAGKFKRATLAAHIYKFADDYTVANAVKWAIEYSTGIKCVWHGEELLAEAVPSSADKLANIALSVSESFRELWNQFAKVPGINAADRGVFIMGLYDGMMNEVKPELLPGRSAKPVKIARAKKKSVASPPGVALHPYSVAVGYGKQVRFSTPWNVIAADLENFIPKEIAP
jgi:hypothetical protein